MFCTKCGKEMQNGALFCDACGNRVSEDIKGKEAQPSERNRKGRKALLLIPLAVVVIAVAVAVFIGHDNSKVIFQDPLVERCVRLTLDKEWDEPVTRKECREIEHLLIDCDLDVSFIDAHPTRTDYVTGNYIDLCDLKYMTGLKKLNIDNKIARDVLMNLDVITGCRQLESLTMRYNPMDKVYFGGVTYGYRYLAGLVEKLPRLEHLDLGYQVAKEHQELIAGEREGLEITGEATGMELYSVLNSDAFELRWAEDATDYGSSWKYAYNDAEIAPSIKFLKVTSGEDLEAALQELPRKTEDILIYFYTKGADRIDARLFEDFKHLKTLTVLKKVVPISRELLYMDHLDALEQNTELFALSLHGVEGDWEALAKIAGLKSLSLSYCMIDQPEFLERLPQLTELSVTRNDGDDLEHYLTKNADKFKNLKSLRITNSEESDFKGIQDFRALEALNIDYTPLKNMKYVAQCPELKYLSATVKEEETDISEFSQLKKLQFLSIGLYRTSELNKLRGVEEVLKLPALVSLTLPGLFSSQENYEIYNRWIDIAADHPKLSYFKLAQNGLDRLTQGNESAEEIYEEIDLEKLWEAGIICGEALDLRMFISPEKYPRFQDTMIKQ